jgi:hypothetical protein
MTEAETHNERLCAHTLGDQYVVVVVVNCWRDIHVFNVGLLASLRLTTTKAETHNERLCAHMLGDQYWACVSLCVC